MSTPLLGAAADPLRSERSIGSSSAPMTVVEYFSLSCPHCADFALHSLPEIKVKWIAPGKLRWVFHDFPTDKLALRAAVIARYLPPERYEFFIERLFATQDRWAFTGDQELLWPLASSAGMDHATYEKAVADKDLRDWIILQAMKADENWHVDATPSFLVNGRLYAGAMSASEFSAILAG